MISNFVFEILRHAFLFPLYIFSSQSKELLVVLNLFVKWSSTYAVPKSNSSNTDQNNNLYVCMYVCICLMQFHFPVPSSLLSCTHTQLSVGILFFIKCQPDCFVRMCRTVCVCSGKCDQRPYQYFHHFNRPFTLNTIHIMTKTHVKTFCAIFWRAAVCFVFLATTSKHYHVVCKSTCGDGVGAKKAM